MFTQDYLNGIGQLLLQHEIINDIKVLNDYNLDDFAADFQKKVGLRIDGIIGPETLWNLQYPLIQRNTKQKFVKVDADIVKNIAPFGSLVLRNDTAEIYKKVKAEVNLLGGLLTTSGGKRELSAQVTQSRSSKSLHYTGLALDLAITSGFFKPETDPYIIVRNPINSLTYWTVYCRADKGQEMELDAIFWKTMSAGKDETMKVKGKFINLTQIFIKHGFVPIKPRKGFLRVDNRDYLSSEWWHFQANRLLVKGVSQFGIELLKLEEYTEEFLQKFQDIWGARKEIFYKTWY